MSYFQPSLISLELRFFLRVAVKLPMKAAISVESHSTSLQNSLHGNDYVDPLSLGSDPSGSERQTLAHAWYQSTYLCHTQPSNTLIHGYFDLGYWICLIDWLR